MLIEESLTIQRGNCKRMEIVHDAIMCNNINNNNNGRVWSDCWVVSTVLSALKQHRLSKPYPECQAPEVFWIWDFLGIGLFAYT